MSCAQGYLGLAMALLLVLLPGCRGCRTPREHREAADHEVSGLLAATRAKVPGSSAAFSIEPAPQVELARFAVQGRPPAAVPEALEALSPEALAEADKGQGIPPVAGAIRLGLREALELAARHSRDYQTRKEDLYLAALTLTLERFRWKPQWTGVLTAGVTRGPDDSFVEAGSDFSVSQLLGMGGQVTASVTTDFLRFLTGDPRNSAASLFAVEVLQPLLRRSGRLVAREPLTQAERDTVYALRTFARFRKSFCVDVTSRYYRVLQQRDAVANQWSNYRRLGRSRRDSEELEKRGMLEALRVAQTRQDELRAEANWVRELRRYRELLDEFKVFLGLPVEAQVELDPAELDRLREAGLKGVRLSPEAAVELALRQRLDLLTAYDRVADAERAVAIAENGLLPDLDLALSASVPSEPPTHFLDPEPRQGTYSAGLTLGLPLRRIEERNVYRRALINLERARRAAKDLEEQVKLSVRDAWRTLQEAAASYRIESDSVRLAQLREQGERELFRIGEAIARDVLDANEALVNAQNAVTRTLVDHTLARLALWRDTELLEVDEHGVWQEVPDAQP